MQKQLLQESVRIIIQLHQELKSSSIISSDLAQALIQVASQIDTKSQNNRKYIDYSKDQNVQRNIKQMKQPQTTNRPSPQCRQIFSSDCLNDNIFPYLDLLDLQRFRCVNSEINYYIQQYIRRRLPEEERMLANHLFSSYYLTEFKQYLYQHLPQQNWFILDYTVITNNLKKYSKDFEAIRKLHNIPKKYECIIKAISILFNGNQKTDQLSRINGRLFMKEEKKIQVQAKRYSIELHNAIEYCYNRISQYYLENIFEVCMKIQQEHQFNQIVEFYYRYMKIINFWKQVLQQSERFELVLDFTCFRTSQIMLREEQSRQNSFMSQLNSILQFCSNKTILKLRLLNKKVKNICEEKLKQRLAYSIYKYESTKQKNQLGFFNPIFQMSYQLLMEKYKQLVIFNKFDNISQWNKEFVFYISTAFQQLHGMQNFNQLCGLQKKQLISLISTYLNPFNKTQTQIELADHSLRNLMNLIQTNPLTSQNFEAIYPFFLYLKLFVIINCSIYPTVYDNDQITHFKQCLQYLRIMFVINKISDMEIIINEAFSYFSDDQKNVIAQNLDQQFFELQNSDSDDYESTLKLLTQIVALYDSRISNNKIQIVETFELKKHSELFINKILYYIGYQELAVFASVSKLGNEIQIQHIQKRVFKEEVSIRNLESQNKLALQKVLIINKCAFQISKENAIQLIQQFSHHDFCELRNINHPNKNFETFALPFLILFDLKKQSRVSNWQTLQVYFLKPNIFTFIQEIAPELICKKKIMAIKDLFKQEDITFENLAKTSTCLLRLYNWLQGNQKVFLQELKYCITDKEYHLTVEQQNLCELLDKKQLILYKAMRYINQ